VQRIDDRATDSMLDLVWAGVASLTIWRGNGDSLAVWLTTTDGREISLAHCPLPRHGKISIPLDSENVQVKTWPTRPANTQER
jgi:hypothetical protein